MKRWGEQKPLRFDQKELKTDLGKNNFIFVGSSTDMWAKDVPEEWISGVLDHCKKFPDNKYLFQSKNPQRFTKFYDHFPENVILATTLESNQEYPEIYKNSPSIMERYNSIQEISQYGINIMLTIEPILDFDLDEFIEMIKTINPSQINIGADSGGHKLPEPSKDKIMKLIEALGETVVKKTNLNRLSR